MRPTHAVKLTQRTFLYMHENYVSRNFICANVMQQKASENQRRNTTQTMLKGNLFSLAPGEYSILGYAS